MLLFRCTTCSVKEVMSGGSPGTEGLIAQGHEGADGEEMFSSLDCGSHKLHTFAESQTTL